MKVSTSNRRIVKVGNSLGVTLPSTVLQGLNVRKEDQVHVESNGDQIIIKKMRETIELPEGITKDFFQIVSEEMVAHHEILKGLGRR